MDAGGDDGQRHAGENVGIVTLTRVEGLAVVGYWQERRTAGKNSFSLKEAINFKWIGNFVFSRKTLSLRQYVCKRLRPCTRLC